MNRSSELPAGESSDQSRCAIERSYLELIPDSIKSSDELFAYHIEILALRSLNLSTVLTRSEDDTCPLSLLKENELFGLLEVITRHAEDILTWRPQPFFAPAREAWQAFVTLVKCLDAQPNGSVNVASSVHMTGIAGLLFGKTIGIPCMLSGTLLVRQVEFAGSLPHPMSDLNHDLTGNLESLVKNLRLELEKYSSGQIVH